MQIEAVRSSNTLCKSQVIQMDAFQYFPADDADGVKFLRNVMQMEEFKFLRQMMQMDAVSSSSS
jgi:hypothetical protein